MSTTQSDRLVRRAIRQSSEGVIFFPSKKAQQVYELPRLNEIAQGLRRPAAACFLRRAIETMRPDDKQEQGFAGVPEGQVKIRVRISPGGETLQTEVLETGFEDQTMPPCLQDALRSQKWPPNKRGHSHYIDVVYWVSLGFQPGVGTEAYAQKVHREEVEAGLRAKGCFIGRVPPGRYEIEGLNLVNRDGKTMVNRTEGRGLDPKVRACITHAFGKIRLPDAPESFVRPVLARVSFDVGSAGEVMVGDEEWLRLLKLEERAQRAADRARLEGGDGSADADPNTARPVADVPEDRAVLIDDIERPPVRKELSDSVEESDKPEPVDPAQRGLKLDLSGRGR